MTARTWPKSVRPDQRGHSWNTAVALMAGAFRRVEDGERVVAALVVVRNGEGRSSVITSGPDGTRRVSSDEDEVEVA